MCAGISYAFGCDGPTCLASAGLALGTMRIALLDWRLRLIDDLDLMFVVGTGVAWATWSDGDVVWGLVGACGRTVGYTAGLWTVGVAFERLRGRKGVGLGDIKLAGAAGPWLAPSAFALSLALASLGGLAFALLRTRRRRRRSFRHLYIPFGSFLVMSIAAAWLFQIWA